MEIKITCESSGLVPVDELENFQGKLKSIDAASFAKLKESILKYGFSFPIFVWEDNILDGHQRFAAVKSLLAEGHTLDGNLLPVDHIEARDKKEAAEKLLLINSRYAKIDQDGFNLFIEDFELDIDDFGGLLDIPEIDLTIASIEKEIGDTDYNDEWNDMPEFEQDDILAFRSIIVHFENQENLNKFIELIQQPITEKTKFIYYPKQIRNDLKSLEYSVDNDES